MGSLYIVSTPIGNKEDITARAERVLFTADLILAEDTRKTISLLKSYRPEQRVPEMISFFEGNEANRLDEILKQLKSGKNIALVSNAGTPLISDPGFKLVRACIENNIPVIPIPGASALLAAIVASGLPTDKFFYLGFLPKKSGKREKLIASLENINEILPAVFVFYESPYRILKSLELIKNIYPKAKVVLAREITKKFEEFYYMTAQDLIEKLKNEAKIKGEMVVLLHLA